MYGFDWGASDAATMEGTIEVVERLSFRHVIKNAVDPEDALSKLTLGSPQASSSGLHVGTYYNFLSLFCVRWIR